MQAAGGVLHGEKWQEKASEVRPEAGEQPLRDTAGYNYSKDRTITHRMEKTLAIKKKKVNENML